MAYIEMGVDDWYERAKSALESEEGLVLLVSGKAATRLRKHLGVARKKDKAGTWFNLFCMARYRDFHRLYFSGVAIGLGVAMEDNGGGDLLIRMNRRIGLEQLAAGVVVVDSARRS